MIKTNEKSVKYIFILAVLFASLGMISSDLYLPSLPAVAEQLHASIALTQVTVAIFALGFSLARLFYGLISDAFGRKKPLIGGLFLCLAGSIICYLAPNIYVLLLGRLLQGFGAGGSNILGRVILRDRLEGIKLAEYSSYFSMAGISLMAVAPLLGGYIQEYLGWRATFLILSLYAVVALGIAIFLLPETNLFRNTNLIKIDKLKHNVKILFTHESFLFYAAILFATFGGMYAWLTSGPVILQNVLGLSAVQFGWCAGLVGAVYFIGAFVNGRLVKKIGTYKMIRFGTTSIFAAGCLAVLTALFGYVNVVSIVLPVSIAVFGLSMVTPNAYAEGLSPFPQIAGISVAILGTIQMAGAFTTSSIVSLSPDRNQLPLGLIFLTLGLVSSLLVFLLKKSG